MTVSNGDAIKGSGKDQKIDPLSVGENIAPEISPEEVRKLLNVRGDAILIDIRSDREARLGHIEKARFVPAESVEDELKSLRVIGDTPIVLYCSSGNRSLVAAWRLAEKGYTKIYSMAGGYVAWMNLGYPIVKESELTATQLNRYSRQILLEQVGEEGQLRLLKSKILIVGAGGLGSPVGLYLASCGVGTLGIADFDAVDLSNLNRQIFHGTKDVGKLKTESARETIQYLNPDVKVVLHNTRVEPDNILDIIDNYDMVIDASDNVGTKFLINDACYFAGKPSIYGGAVQLEGQMSVFYPKGGGPCLRCLFPVPPPAHLAPS